MPKRSTEAENLVSKKLEELRLKAQELYSVNIEPSVSFDLRGQSAGQANYRTNRIRLNRQLLEKYTTEFVVQTVPHEFAHLVAHKKFGRRIKPHGHEWRSVMIALGAKPSRTHNFAVSPTRKLRRYMFQCNCHDKKHELTSIRYNRIKRGVIYYCPACKRPLRPA